MTDRDLKNMNRKELLELLIDLEKENDHLKHLIEEQENIIQSRDIRAKKAGTLAEAALALNSVFENADKAAAQYLDNIKRYNEQARLTCEMKVSEAEKKASMIIADAENEKKLKIKEADAYWDNIHNKLEAFYQEHVGLKELLTIETKRTVKKD